MAPKESTPVRPRSRRGGSTRGVIELGRGGAPCAERYQLVLQNKNQILYWLCRSETMKNAINALMKANDRLTQRERKDGFVCVIIVSQWQPAHSWCDNETVVRAGGA